MYLASVITIIVAFMARITVGFYIPEGQPNGVYSVQVLENGTEHHVRIGDIPTIVQRRYTTHGISLRDDEPKYQIHCFPEEGFQDLDHLSTDLANAAVDEWCGTGRNVFNGQNVYAISECVVAYYCHLKSTWVRDSTCYAEERRRTSSLISATCGPYKPGSAQQVDDVPTYFPFFYGYESYCTPQGHNYCGNAVGKRLGE